MNAPVDVTVAPMAPGEAAGPALVLDEPLSLWGGVDPATATIVDRLHRSTAFP